MSAFATSSAEEVVKFLTSDIAKIFMWHLAGDQPFLICVRKGCPS